MANPILQNPTFGTVKTKTSPAVTSVNHLATVEADGTLAKIDPVLLPLSDATNTAINNIYQPNQLISSVAPTRAENTFTFPAEGYQALINKTLRTNPAQFVTTINPATTDYKRVDLIYFKSDNTLDKVIGVESLTVAVRPDVPANAVAISFINVFGNVVETPTPITQEISIQDIFGSEQFKISDYIRFEGVSMNPAQKLISINPLVPLSAFLDITNGNDVTGAIENASKPFKTLEKLIASLPAFTGETFTIYMKGATVPVLRQLPNRNINWVSITGTILDFTDCKLADGVTEAQNCLINVGGSAIKTWNFTGRNISIVCNFVGKKTLDMSQTANLLIFGTINTCNWKSVANTSSSGVIGPYQGSDFTIVNLYDSPQANTFLWVQGNTLESRITIENLNIEHGRTLTRGFVGECIIKNINHLGAATISNWQMHGGLPGSANTRQVLKTVNFRGKIEPRVGHLLFDNCTFSSTTTLTCSSTAIIEGVLNSTTYAGGSPPSMFRNFTGKVAELKIYTDVPLTFQNCNIETVDWIYSRETGTTAGYTKSIFFVGLNVINRSAPTTLGLFRAHGWGGNPDVSPTKPIELTISGILKTNSTFYGKNVTYINTDLTFKEKSKEVIIRNKIDLINKVLDSTTKYIIDGNITLLTGEYIEVPSGGLDIGGYGFDTSTISKSVLGQSIFISPIGGSGNFVSSNIAYYPGLGSVFNLNDSTGGHAIELNDVNFQGVTGSSLGTLNGYRQFTGTTCGFYGLSDGLTLEGNWSGFKLTNSNIIGFASTGTLFKKGTATVFSNRFYIDLNLQIAVGSKIADFDPANFTNDKSFQVVNCYNKVNGVIDDTTTATIFPNITPYSSKSYFVNNIGIKNSNQSPYGISTVNMQTYADDAAASAGGIVQIGEMYIESATGYPKVRLT